MISYVQKREEFGMQPVITNVKESPAEGTTGLYDAPKKHHLKTFVDLYKVKVSTTQNVSKTIKSDRKLLHCGLIDGHPARII